MKLSKGMQVEILDRSVWLEEITKEIDGIVFNTVLLEETFQQQEVFLLVNDSTILVDINGTEVWVSEEDLENGFIRVAGSHE